MEEYLGHKIKVIIKMNPQRVLESSNLLAQATVIINDVIEIHGWRIMKSKILDENGLPQLWIQEPSTKTNQGWKSIVYINDKGFFSWVKLMINNSYKDTNDYEKTKGESNSNKKLDADSFEIPF